MNTNTNIYIGDNLDDSIDNAIDSSIGNTKIDIPFTKSFLGNLNEYLTTLQSKLSNLNSEAPTFEFPEVKFPGSHVLKVLQEQLEELKTVKNPEDIQNSQLFKQLQATIQSLTKQSQQLLTQIENSDQFQSASKEVSSDTQNIAQALSTG